MTEPAPDITGLLKSWANGDESALRESMPLVYGELRRIAAYHMRAEAVDAGLEDTARVHEAYVGLGRRQGLAVSRAWTPRINLLGPRKNNFTFSPPDFGESAWGRQSRRIERRWWIATCCGWRSSK